MNQLSIDIADWNFVPLVRRLAVTDFFKPRAISREEPVNRPGAMSIALDVSWTCRTQPRRFIFSADARRAGVLPDYREFSHWLISGASSVWRAGLSLRASRKSASAGSNFFRAR